MKYEVYHPTEIYNDRKIFLIGSTGFLGKVTLSMLLHSFPNIGPRLRDGPRPLAGRIRNAFLEQRNYRAAFRSFARALWKRFEGFIRDKVAVLGGDIGDTNLGYSEEQAQAVADDIDVIINSAGNVTFNPTLESALRTNVVGTQNVIAFAKRMKRPALIHVSTCFVAGNRSGPVWESDPVLGYFPRKHEIEGSNSMLHRRLRIAPGLPSASARKPATR